MKTFLIALILPLSAVAAKKDIPTTRDKALGMFRAPSGSKPVKIKRKFQPIDHMIKGTSENNTPPN